MNDEVVPVRVTIADINLGTSGVVHHLSYFAQPDVATFIRRSLALA